MRLTKFELIPAGIMALAILIMSAVMWAPKAHAQDFKCFVGASVGYGVSAIKAEDGSDVLKVATQSPMLSPEAGCKMSISAIVLGGLARYDFLDIKGNGITGNGRWMLAGTFGWSPLPGAELYALAGFSGSKLKFDGESAGFQSYVVGGGANLALSKSLDLFGEYNAFIGRSKIIEGVKITPDEHVVRAGLRVKLN